MSLEVFFHAGYALIIVSILLMLWITYSSAAICQFDAQCRCSSVYPTWGEVECHNARVHITALNNSKLFTLSLVNNKLDYLPPRLFQGTGLSKLIIENNPIYSLHEESLSGLERVLWELHVVDCKLSSIPGNAVRHLYRLKILNLDGNEISTLNIEQLKGVSTSLQTLILSNNRLTVLPSGIFSSLQSLEVLDLHGNSISSLDPSVFTPAPPKLRDLILADNLFDNIPYKQLANIRSLHSLDLSNNHISKVDQGITGIKLTLDTLMLEYNDITSLGSYSMANFEVANKTSFKANPLKTIEANAFQGCRILDLSFSECQLQQVNPEAFNGLENSLQNLDLSDNPISNISYFAFNRYNYLQRFSLDDAHLRTTEWLGTPENASEGIRLLKLHINGKKGSEKVTLSRLPRLGTIQTLSISYARIDGLSQIDLSPFSIELENFIAHGSGISSLQANTFIETRGIKTLDLTDNNINKIDSTCFVELGHSLENLILMHAFSSSITILPPGFLKPLSALKVLKINHNYLMKLPQDLIYLSQLQIFYAHDNKIDSLSRNTFKSSTHRNLIDINLSFNKINKIPTNSFFELEKILEINLAENLITTVEPGAFGNLGKLTSLSIRGNIIANLNAETFQNIPCLQYLDLAFNKLTSFNFASLDQVGTLSSLTVNVSNNLIKTLVPEMSFSSRDNIYASIKVLDYSHNNISFIDKNYLIPVQHTLTHLYLSHNAMSNASRDFLPEMHLLQLLDLSHNFLNEIEFDALRSARYLQVISLAHNRLKDIPDDLFLNLNSLRSVDLSHNFLYTVMDSMMSPPNLAVVDISYNDLTRVPLSSFSPIAASSVNQLYLGHNRIAGLPPHESFSRFENLRELDLSSNRLSEIGNSLSLLPSLTKLNLAHNFIHIGGKDFLGLEDTLEHLDLTNVSVSYVPSLPLPNLKTLKMAHNLVSFLPIDLSTNLTSLKYLDISYNDLQSVPQFSQLKTLYLAGNDISIISNTSFNEYPLVYDLDIRHLPLTGFDEEGLTSLLGLQFLHVSNYKNIKNFNIPQWTVENKGLRYLHIELRDSGSLEQELKGTLPGKVRHIALTGKEIKSLPDSLLKGIQYPSAILSLRNTSVENIQASLFSSLPNIRNISIDVYNNSLKSLANPATSDAFNRLGKSFLIDLYMQNNPWTCDCQLGLLNFFSNYVERQPVTVSKWIESWQRKRRQLYGSMDYTIEDVRRTKCKNKQNKSLLDVLKTDIECKGCLAQPTIFLVLVSIILALFKNCNIS